VKRLVGLLLLAGCNQLLGIDDFHTGGDVDGGGVDAAVASACGPLAEPGQVKGCATVTYVKADGSTVVAKKDMSVYTVAAYVPDDSATGFQIINGTGSADGVVLVEGVPDGPYFLRLHDPTDPFYPIPHYFYVDQRDLDLGSVARGRDDTPATLATSVTVNLTGMQPWKEPDFVQLTSINAGTDNGVSGGVVGNTTLDSTVDWQGGYAETTFADLHDVQRSPQLIDSEAPNGDDFWALHARAVVLTAGGQRALNAHSIIDAYTSNTVTMTNGTPTTIAAALAPVPMVTAPQQFQANLSNARTAMGDSNRYATEDLQCSRHANPGASYGLVGGQLFGLSGTPWTGANAIFVELPYANPFPIAWPQMMTCSLGHVHLARVNGQLRYGYSYLNSYTAASDDYTWTFATRAPSNILVGGVSGLDGGAIAFDGTAPVTMTWDPVAGVSHYSVRVLGATEGLVAKFDTFDTTLTMPADTFVVGHFYIFRLYAIQTSGDYAGGHLFEMAMPIYWARLATGWFRFSDQCGDGNVDAGEDCDPGPGGSTASCDADCTPAACGDGFVNAMANEVCDEAAAGGGATDAPHCDSTCRSPVCNDGHWNPSAEECDDGNQVDSDGCTNTCVLTSCGDGTPQSPFEQCDDGNLINGDGCDAFCQPDIDVR
jgi:cysteine-rich repeat protein